MRSRIRNGYAGRGNVKERVRNMRMGRELEGEEEGRGDMEIIKGRIDMGNEE